ncbi:bifunctional DNA primase/polymerase [Archangium lansingense]|uniref:Bifunctional DNA primase/polymerase n=1 Tax=Archangium lansingense TaxID=2995310 RepID=A0ABT4AB15_9BACT|nr:bifunctional DNA primase/polymerase [Archangium lansinium]MCY1078870.1 bifunctional DNA primase/polymerase [Archangium lansinium]
MVTQANALLTAALKYAARGWRVFPCWWTENGRCACPSGAACTSPGKHPLTRHGVKDASTDTGQIRAWWGRWPPAHVAIATGAESRLVVIDLDRKPGKDGVASLNALGQVPVTLSARTGSGGLHLYFKHPGGRVPSTSSKVGLGIDVRADYGYVIAPPSGHISGGRYEW